MKKALAVVGLGAAIAAGALTGAGTASGYTGNEVAYLHSFVAGGGYVYDVDRLITTGYQICNSFSYKNGNEIAVDVFRNSSWADVPTLHVAQRWVNNAADTLCPWVWESGSVRAIW